ncbi:NAD(P)-binding protein [Infundibulicybe gibba]|nr:NAD(P)-binding protein [Infundibulicybe gibba]
MVVSGLLIHHDSTSKDRVAKAYTCDLETSERSRLSLPSCISTLLLILHVYERIAVVTGAAKGIGREIALRLADDGFDVGLNDIPPQMEALESLSQEILRKGSKSTIVVGDVSVEEDVKSLVSRVGAALGGLDVMVANAGICITKSIMETTLDEWERLFAINSRGVFLCHKYAGEYMINQGRGGRLIAASSLGGKQGYDPLGAYCTTKFAVRGMTQAFAKALGKHGITVNAYAPGLIETDMLHAIGEEVGGGAKKFYASQIAAIPVGSLGTPADIASIVLYLASKESRFITGARISVNGGVFFD